MSTPLLDLIRAIPTKAPTGASTHDGIEIFLLNDQATADQSGTLAAALTVGGAIPASTFYNTVANNKPTYRLPPGEFVFTQTITNIHAGAVIVGAGKGQTVLYSDIAGDAPLFMLGADHTSVTDVYAPTGSIQGVEFRDLSMVRLYNNKGNKPYGDAGPPGSRTGSGIKMVGGGSCILTNVSMAGFKYGNNQVCGSDFSQVTNCDFSGCDVGQYFGPGAQQVNHYNVTYYDCVEGLVTDRVGTLNQIGSVFNSCKESGWTIEAPGDSSTRQLTSFDPSGTSLNCRLYAVGTWFEGGAGGIANTTPTFYVKIDIRTSDTIRGLTLADTILVSAPGPKQTTAFIGAPAASQTYGIQEVEIRNVTSAGNIGNVFYNNGPNCSVTGQWVGNFPVNGVTNVDGTVYWENEIRDHMVPAALAYDTYYNQARTRGTRIHHDVENDRIHFQVLYNGSWLTRGTFDMGQSSFGMGDNSAGSPWNDWNSTIPTDSVSARGIGSIRFNTNPQPGGDTNWNAGWIQTANGWKPFGTIAV